MTLYIGAGMQHIFPIYCGAIPEADAAVAMIGTFIRARISQRRIDRRWTGIAYTPVARGEGDCLESGAPTVMCLLEVAPSHLEDARRDAERDA